MTRQPLPAVAAATATLLALVAPPALAEPAAAGAGPAVEEENPPNMEPGGLVAQGKDGKPLPLVLEHTAVDAHVAGNLARVFVTQRFKNPYKQPLEAIYAFPMPEKAAVDEMKMKVGGRVIVGFIKKRAEAKKIYERAKSAGQTAALLDQERPNVFTQRVANIKPGEAIEVTIAYSDALRFEGSRYRFVFPTVVGPRYTAGSGAVPDAELVKGQALPVGTRSGRDLALSMRLTAGVPITNIASNTHEIQVEGTEDAPLIKLAPHDAIPNRDLVIRYTLAQPTTAATVLAQRDKRGGHFAAFMIPAVRYRDDEVVPKDVVFLMDTSGSQSGEPIVQSKALLKRMIDGLNGDDTFTVIDFANAATRLSDKPLANTEANRSKAHAYVDKLSANGGTELMNGIETVLKFPPQAPDRLRSIVLVTDGLIGDDQQVIGEVKKRLPRGTRLYSFGVGSGTNRFLLERLAEVGRGTCTIVDPTEPIRPVAERFYRHINDPVVTDIEVAWDGPGPAPQLYPAVPPDLFAAQPLVIHGRKPDGKAGALRVRGRLAGGKPYATTIPVTFAEGGNPAIAQLWGRARLAQLEDDMASGETPAGKAAATATALDYRLMSKYTSFVAVTAHRRVAPTDGGVTTRVPQEPAKGLTFQAYGDPHVVTGDGLKFDLSAVGEFVGMASRAGDFALHTRIGAGLVDHAHTYNVALALRTGKSVVAYDARTRKLTVDGKAIWLKPGESHRLPDGGRIRALDRGWIVLTARGDRVTIKPVGDHLDFHVEPAPDRPSGDLFGALGTIDADDRPENDLRDRRGRVVDPPTGPASEARFVEGWRVRPAERLLQPEQHGPAPLPAGMAGPGAGAGGAAPR